MSPRFKWLVFSLVLLVLTPATAPGQQGKPTSEGAATSSRSHQAGIDPALAEAAKSFVATGCDDSLRAHVYHPQRLKVVEKCISVTGIIHHIKKEADGDDHIQVRLDPEFANLLNARNKAAQAASLVVEPICQNPVTQADAQTACRDFHSSVEVPPKGSHVRVLGSYVLDSEARHGWMEIHPVTSIEVVQ